MIHAYDEDYLASAQRILGDMLDYAVNSLEMEPESFYALFALSDTTIQFESGNPAPIETVLYMYPTLHEADIMRFVGIMDEKLADYYTETNLKRLLTNAGISQKKTCGGGRYPASSAPAF